MEGRMGRGREGGREGGREERAFNSYLATVEDDHLLVLVN